MHLKDKVCVIQNNTVYVLCTVSKPKTINMMSVFRNVFQARFYRRYKSLKHVTIIVHFLN